MKDKRSLLWDQASWLWLCSSYYYLTQHFKEQFTANPPVDGGVLEKDTAEVALGLASAILKNIQAMHMRDGRLASVWSPGAGPGERASIEDIALTLVALKDVIDRFAGDSAAERALRQEATALLKTQADLLLKEEALRSSETSAPLCWGVRGLLAAWQPTQDERYLQGAYQAFNRLNEKFWDEKSGLYRTRLGEDTVTLTPREIAATLGALREMSFALERSQIRAHLERLTRFWVQAMDVSGVQMAENFQTGELHYGMQSADEDQDGIPFAGKAHGRYGIAPVAAGRVYVNIGGPANAAFHALKGEVHATPTNVKYAYKPEERPTESLRADKAPVLATIHRTSGLSAFAADPKTGPAHADSGLSGAEIFRMNCAVCHGARGQGITGKPLASIVQESGARAVIVDGRPMQRMPAWGHVLTPAEISRLVNYLEGLFKK